MNSLHRDGDNLILKAKFSLSWNDFYKTIPGHRWDPTNKVWTFPYSPQTLEVIRAVIVPLDIDGELEGKTDQKELEDKRKWIDREYEVIKKNETRYESKMEPFKHQLIAWDFIKDRRCAALLMEMGTGKTKTAIDAMNYVWKHKEGQRKGFKILWICPTSVMYNAAKEMEMNSSIPLNVSIMKGLKKRRLSCIVEFANSAESYSQVLILNYEAVRTLEEELIASEPDMVILDESTKIKNPQAQVSKALYKIGKVAKYRYIMTGSPITQSPVDIYSQYKFLDDNIFGKSFTLFKAKYVIFGGWEGREIIGYRNIDEIKEKIYSIGIRFMKKECLDLPDKVYEKRFYELEGGQKEIYNSMKKDLVAEFGGGLITAQAAIVKLLRLSQICSGFVTLDHEPGCKPLPQYLNENPKLKVLEEVLEELEDKKVVVWCRFINEIKMIEGLLTKIKRPFFSFWGETKKDQRQNIIEEFNNGKGPTVFIGQIQTGGMGINLTGAHNMVYYSNSYSLQDRLQSEDRCHRSGQRNEVLYIDIIGQKTIEESVLQALKSKHELSSLLTRDNLQNLIEGDLQ